MRLLSVLSLLCWLHPAWLNAAFAQIQELFLWPPGPGATVSPQLPDAELAQMLTQINTSNIQSGIATLVSFGTRNTLSTQTNSTFGIGAARDWIASQMRTIAATSGGRMVVTVPSYTQGPASNIPSNTVISNVIATLTGASEPNRVYVISGHYDSRNTNVTDPVGDAPGAGDDGSGVMIVLELARIMATHTPAATIIFAAVAGEEQGLYGSNFLAQQLKNASMDVQGMLDNDIVGSSTGDDGTQDPFNVRLFVQGIPSTDTLAQVTTTATVGGENDSPIRELGKFVADVGSNSFTNMSVQIIYRSDRYLRGGDHQSFIKAGFPAVRFTEPRENFAHQHQNVRVVNGVQFGDLEEFLDYNFITRVAKINMAALWSLAQAPGTPKNVQLDTSVLTNNSTILWTADSHATGGYEIVWRPTIDPFWMNVVPVGNVSSATVLLSKDDVDFGVRAVGANGFRSPAAFAN